MLFVYCDFGGLFLFVVVEQTPSYGVHAIDPNEERRTTWETEKVRSIGLSNKPSCPFFDDILLNPFIYYPTKPLCVGSEEL